MKTYIVSGASLFILSFFVLLFSTQQRIHFQETTFQTIVSAHGQEARKEGYFTSEIIENMKDEISKSLYIDKSEIVIVSSETTLSPVYRDNTFDENEVINYKVGVPIKEIIPMANFLGIEKVNNQTIFYVTGPVSTEVY